MDGRVSKRPLHLVTFCCEEGFILLIHILAVLQDVPLKSQVLGKLWRIWKLLRLSYTVFGIVRTDWAITQPEWRSWFKSRHGLDTSTAIGRHWPICVVGTQAVPCHLLNGLGLFCMRYRHLRDHLGCLNQGFLLFYYCLLMLSDESVFFGVCFSTLLQLTSELSHFVS